jgi:hypothetical protein
MPMDVDVEVPVGAHQEVREEQSGETGVEQGQGQGVDMGRLMNSIEITKVSPHVRNFEDWSPHSL